MSAIAAAALVAGDVLAPEVMIPLTAAGVAGTLLFQHMMQSGGEPPELRPVQDGTIRPQRPIPKNGPVRPEDRPGANGQDAYGNPIGSRNPAR